MKFQSLYVGAVFLAGCASQQPPGSNEPKSQRNYNRDLYECEREAPLLALGTSSRSLITA